MIRIEYEQADGTPLFLNPDAISYARETTVRSPHTVDIRRRLELVVSGHLIALDGDDPLIDAILHTLRTRTTGAWARQQVAADAG